MATLSLYILQMFHAFISLLQDPMSNFVPEFFPMVELSTRQGHSRIFATVSNVASFTHCATFCYFESQCHFFSLTNATMTCNLGSATTLYTLSSVALQTFYIRAGDLYIFFHHHISTVHLKVGSSFLFSTQILIIMWAQQTIPAIWT